MRAWRLREDAKTGSTKGAVRNVAFSLAFGIDLGATLAAPPAERAAVAARLTRLLERERLRGGNRHWSYDLNRHIALKQALDLFEAALRKQNGARRRRRER